MSFLISSIRFHTSSHFAGGERGDEDFGFWEGFLFREDEEEEEEEGGEGEGDEEAEEEVEGGEEEGEEEDAEVERERVTLRFVGNTNF